MSEAIKFEKSSVNVFLDIDFSEEESERELLRSDLAFEVHSILEERKLTQSEIGKILGIDQSDVSRLKNGDFHCFIVERLSVFLNRLNITFDIHTNFRKTRTNLGQAENNIQAIRRIDRQYV